MSGEATIPKLGFVHHFVPPAGKGQPTLLLLHGTGGNENDMVPVGRELAPKAGMLSPRGKVLENGMPRFFRRFAAGIFDLKDLVFRSQELAVFLRAASASYGFDARNVVAVGYSNGANIATSLILLHPDALAGAVLFRPMLPLVPNQLPDLTNLKIFISAGNLDPIVSWQETERLVSFLRKTGARFELNLADADHSLRPTEIQKAKEWLHNNFLDKQ